MSKDSQKRSEKTMEDKYLEAMFKDVDDMREPHICGDISTLHTKVKKDCTFLAAVINRDRVKK